MSDSKASYFGDNEDWHWHRENGLGRVINVSGTMTGLGASRAHPEVSAATANSMGHFVRMHELQARASATIAALTGAEAGCIQGLWRSIISWLLRRDCVVDLSWDVDCACRCRRAPGRTTRYVRVILVFARPGSGCRPRRPSGRRVPGGGRDRAWRPDPGF